jgi:murein DD-endopeptidase MepM/ murein hydrolase activator NlpD
VTIGGVQIDSRHRGPRANSTEDHWSLEKAVRLRVWPPGRRGSSLAPSRIPRDSGGSRAGHGCRTNLTFVDGGEVPANKKIYYHAGLDIGGAEGLVDVVAATNGLVVSSGTDRLAGHEGTPVAPRYDVVYLLDDRGWYYRYSHMKTIDAAITPGVSVKMGQKIGVLGKEGGSGGWSHLHFEVKARQPSGKWGTEEGYAFLWQAYTSEFQPAVIAVARPHHLAAVGDSVTLDGTRSWSRSGGLRSEWILSNGSTATTDRVTQSYDRPGVSADLKRRMPPAMSRATSRSCKSSIEERPPFLVQQAAFAPAIMYPAIR